MYYAVWTITNENHKNYGNIGGFITEECFEGDEEGSPMCREIAWELRDELRGHPLYEAGLVEIIEI